MKRDNENSKQAIIVLHEIYGVNEFIKSQCREFKEVGYDVFSPNMIEKPPYTYEEANEAYSNFTKNIGFDVYKDINELVNKLKDKYENVFIIGFSVGATIAWRCSENSLCSGVVACYGSRIRDYTELKPNCPTLLLFAKESTFDVHALIDQLREKERLSMIEFDAEHGFLDPFSKQYDILQSKRADEYITRFLKECTK